MAQWKFYGENHCLLVLSFTINLYPACGEGEGMEKRSRHQYFIGKKSCQKVSVGINKKYFCTLYFDYCHMDGTKITLMEKHVANVREETGEFDMCRLFSTLTKVESTIGQKFHNYHSRLFFGLNVYFQAVFSQLFPQQQKQTEGSDI